MAALRTYISLNAVGRENKKKKDSIHSFINSNIMRGGERRNQRQ